MNQKQGKRRWRVSTWAQLPSTQKPTPEQEAEQLEAALNRCDALDYDVRDINFEKQFVIGYAREGQSNEVSAEPPTPPPALRSIFPAVPELPDTLRELMERIGSRLTKMGGPAEKQEPLRPVQGAQTNELLSTLQRLASMNPDKVTAGRMLDSAINEIFKGMPGHEFSNSIGDIEYCFEMHKKHQDCTTCPLQTVLLLGIERLKAKLAANPSN